MRKILNWDYCVRCISTVDLATHSAEVATVGRDPKAGDSANHVLATPAHRLIDIVGAKDTSMTKNSAAAHGYFMKGES